MYDVVLGCIRSHPEAHVARRLQAGHPCAEALDTEAESHLVQRNLLSCS